MMTNSKPWETVVNTGNLVNVSATDNKLAVVKKETRKSSAKQDTYYSKPFVSSRRYSIDDNGGGYQGL
jgi:hypothetical protein